MKSLILVLFVAFQTIISSVALAWSPLDSFESSVERIRHCYLTVASSEETQEEKKKTEEGEEEPDCE